MDKCHGPDGYMSKEHLPRANRSRDLKSPEWLGDEWGEVSGSHNIIERGLVWCLWCEICILWDNCILFETINYVYSQSFKIFSSSYYFCHNVYFPVCYCRCRWHRCKKKYAKVTLESCLEYWRVGAIWVLIMKKIIVILLNLKCNYFILLKYTC